jgi:hypothetical protein
MGGLEIGAEVDDLGLGVLKIENNIGELARELFLGEVFHGSRGDDDFLDLLLCDRLGLHFLILLDGSLGRGGFLGNVLRPLGAFHFEFGGDFLDFHFLNGSDRGNLFGLDVFWHNSLKKAGWVSRGLIHDVCGVDLHAPGGTDDLDATSI